MVWDPETLGSEVALHVVMKQSSKFFDLIFEDGGELETIADLERIAAEHPHPDWVHFPGPLFRFLLYHIKETGGTAMAISANHAVMDASMMQLVTEDLDQAIALAAGGTMSAASMVARLPAHVDYKVWADSYYNLRTSSEARAATKWHVQRLASISTHVKTGHLLPVRPQVTKVPDAAHFRFEVPGIHKLREEHPSISPAVLVKAAVALVDVQRTGYTHAVFHSLEAARAHFPFVPKSVLDHASGSSQFEAMDVSGPTFQMVVDVVEIDRGADETALGFLERMQADQRALTKHASAPLLEIIKGLDRASPGAGDVVPRLIGTPHFNWVPGLGQADQDASSHVKMVNAVNRSTTGCTYHAGLGGDKGQTIVVNVSGAGACDEEAAALLGKKTVAVVEWLVKRENWNAPVSSFTAALEGL